MKFFSKKSEPASPKTLNEKEIQKRLYGRYHREGSPEASGKTVSAISPQLEIPRVRKSLPSTHLTKDISVKVLGATSRVAKKIPWGYAVIVLGALVALAVLFQVLSMRLSKKQFAVQESLSQTKAVSPVAVTQPRQTEKRPAVKREPPQVPAVTPMKTVPPVPASPTPESPVSVSRSNYYAVQVCIYQRETDAAALTQKLKGMKFDAFYQRRLSPQQRVPRYVVFLGREKSYAEATSSLGEFKKTEAFNQFPDSFIRSLQS